MSKEIGNNFENKVQKALNSGALWFDKGDLKTKDFVIECKYTEKKGFRISTKILKKLWNEAYDSNKQPKLVVGIKEDNCTWVLAINIKKEMN